MRPLYLMRRLFGPWIGLLLAWTGAAPAQAHRALCYHARPKPGCSTFILTNFGTYMVLGRGETSGHTPLRAVADWGLMLNVSARDAVGASVFFSADRSGFGFGPAVRYRRWIGRAASVEVAVGAPLIVGGIGNVNYALRTGSVFGLVKWSPNHWFAVAARPEFFRGLVSAGCGSINCPGDEVRPRVRLSLGVEMGWFPGLVATPLAVLAMLAAGAGAGSSN